MWRGNLDFLNCDQYNAVLLARVSLTVDLISRRPNMASYESFYLGALYTFQHQSSLPGVIN
jgi:hypothetical protein